MSSECVKNIKGLSDKLTKHIKENGKFYNYKYIILSIY